MNMTRRLVGQVALLGLCLSGCAEEERSELSTQGSTDTGIELSLTTIGTSGSEFRLAPATFAIQRDGSSDAPQLVDASTDSSTLVVPVERGTYRIKLQPGWQLNRVTETNTNEPVPATLFDSEEIRADVNDFTVTPVSFRFRLGASQLVIGAVVDEGGASPGTNDGQISQLSNGTYSISFRSGVMACCFASVADARAAYPGLNLTVL